MVASSYELHSLRGISPTSSQQPALGEDTPRTSGCFTKSISPRHSSDNPFVESNESANSKYPISSSRPRLGNNSWTRELLAWALAALALMILITVLAIYNGNPLDDWNSSVSVNTLINVLTTIASIALIYPVASAIAQMRWLSVAKRESPVADMESFGSGPIDIVVMIWKHPSTFLAYFGALNVVLIILFSPITQATIDLSLEQRNLDLGTGSIPTVSAYRVDVPPGQITSADTTDQDHFAGSKSYDSVARLMNAAINSAIQQIPASFSDVQATCQTGNCTFSDYQTMGVCSKVEDVSSTIVRNCFRRFPGDETPNCFYSVKDLQEDRPYREDNMTIFNIPMSLWVGAGDTGIGDNTEYTDPVSLGTFYTIYFHDKGDINSKSSESSDYTPVLTALKGSLNLCTMTLQTKVTNGVTSTTQTQQTTDLPWAKSQMKINDADTPVISATAADGKAYSITQHSGRGFKIYLADEIFYGNSQTLTGGYWGSTHAAGTLTGLLVDKPKQEGIDGLTKMLDNMAVAMTNALRTTSSSPSTQPGVALTPQTHIRVHFGWLALPIASTILALGFLVAVIVQSARRGVPAWKMSQVKMLLSLDRSAVEKLVVKDKEGRDEEVGALERRAREVRWRLELGEEGWRLRC